MAIRGTLIFLCSLAVLSTSVPQDETTADKCSSQAQHFEHLSTELREAVQCGSGLLSQWSTYQIATLLHSMRTLTDMLQKKQLTECQGAEPKTCPAAEVHSNGGLACVTFSGKRYCKPMCNDGYDFDFLRRSRLYETCSGDRWTTQYIGGNRMAVCSNSSVQVSGAKTAYFPKQQDCLTTKSSSNLQNNITQMFITELKNQGIQGQPEWPCLVCG